MKTSGKSHLKQFPNYIFGTVQSNDAICKVVGFVTAFHTKAFESLMRSLKLLIVYTLGYSLHCHFKNLVPSSK